MPTFNSDGTGQIEEYMGSISTAGCSTYHIWITTGTFFEGLPCSCGRMLWHTEKCPECGQPVHKEIPNPDYYRLDDVFS